jgi:hypothetical protein
MHINVEVGVGWRTWGNSGETREEMARWRSDARSRDPPVAKWAHDHFLERECFSNDLGV